MLQAAHTNGNCGVMAVVEMLPAEMKEEAWLDLLQYRVLRTRHSGVWNVLIQEWELHLENSFVVDSMEDQMVFVDARSMLG